MAADYELKVKISADIKSFSSAMSGVKSSLSVFKDNLLANLASNAITGAFDAVKSGFGAIMDGAGKAAQYVAETGISFSDVMAKVKAISGANADEFADLKAKAEEMGRTTKFTATEAGEAFKYMAMAGWDAEEMIGGIDGIMSLAAASGEDLGRTSDIVTDALTAFGKEAKDAGHFADVLAQASANANTDVGMMGETFKYVAPIAGSMKYSVDDVSLAIGLMANSGIKASQAGTSLRNILKRLFKPTAESAKAIEDLGLQIKNDDGSMRSFDDVITQMRKSFAGLTDAEKGQYAAMLAGSTGMSGLLAIVNATDKDLNDLKESIEGCDGAAENMADIMQDTLGGQLTILQSAIEGFALSIFDNFEEPLKNLAVAGQKAVEKLRAGFEKGTVSSNLADSVKSSVDKIIESCSKLDLEAVGSTVARVVSTIIDVGGQLFASVVEWVASADFDAIGDNIVGTIEGIGQGLLNAGGIILKFAKGFGAVCNNIKGFAAGFAKGFGDAMGRIDWVKIGSGIGGLAKACMGVDWIKLASDMASFAKDVIKGVWNALKEIDWATIGDGIVAVINSFGSLMQFLNKYGDIIELLNPLTNALKPIAALIKFISEHGDVIQSIARAFANATPVIQAFHASAAEISFIMDHWKDLLDAVKSGLGSFAEGAKSAYASLGENAAAAWNTAKEKTGEMIESIKAGWTDLRERTGEKWTEIRDAVTTKVTEIKENAAEKWEEIKKDTSEKVSDMGGKIKEGWEGFKNTVAEKGADIKQASDEKFQEVLDFVGEIPGKFRQFCEDSIHNAAEALQSGGADLYSGVTGAFDDAISYITDLPGQAWQWGSDIVSSLVDGIKNAPANIAGAMSGIADTIGSYIHFSEPDKGPLSDFHTYMPDMMKELTAGIYGGIPALRQAALTAADTISGAVHVDMTGGSSQARYSGTGGVTNTNTTNLGGINVTVHGAAGQDVSALADVVAERILAKMQRAVYV